MSSIEPLPRLANQANRSWSRRAASVIVGTDATICRYGDSEGEDGGEGGEFHCGCGSFLVLGEVCESSESRGEDRIDGEVIMASALAAVETEL